MNNVELQEIWKKYDIYKLSIKLTNVCNKSCSGCNHMIPLAKNKFYLSLNYISNILNHISDENIRLKTILLLGGEPTLYPHLLEAAKLCHSILPNVKIKIVTNGLNLKNWFKYADEFNAICCNFYISNYGELTSVEIAEIKKYFKYVKIEQNKTKSKSFISTNIDLYGKQNSEYSWENCSDKICLQIAEDGRLYRCPEMIGIKYLIDYFNLRPTDLKLEECSIDFLNSSKEDVLKFYKSASSCCRFCNKKDTKIFIPQKSNHLKSEWLDKGSMCYK